MTRGTLTENGGSTGKVEFGAQNAQRIKTRHCGTTIAEIERRRSDAEVPQRPCRRRDARSGCSFMRLVEASRLEYHHRAHLRVCEITPRLWNRPAGHGSRARRVQRP